MSLVRWKRQVRRLVPLLVLLPVAYLARPVFWTPLDQRFYNYFHSKRCVPPWTRVVVVGIDRATREEVFDPPIYPLSRHTERHAEIIEKLDGAGVEGIVFDLDLGRESYGEAPEALASAFRRSGKVFLVASLTEEKRIDGTRETTSILSGSFPHPDLVASSRGVFAVDVVSDPDGVVRRFRPDPRLDRLDLETLPENLAGRKVRGAMPIEFPSLRCPIPMVSYKDVLASDESGLALVRGRIAFIGLVEDYSRDFVPVPRPQSLWEGVRAFGLPGVVVLAAITETLLRGAPIRDADRIEVLAWVMLWCALTVMRMPRRRPALSVLTLCGFGFLALFATALFHVYGGLVFPAGFLLGAIVLCGTHRLVSSHIETAKELHAEHIANVRVRTELETARKTQERFLPKTLPSVRGLDVWGLNISSLEVSGDYYDVLVLEKSGLLLLAIADVAGKGLPAALVMSNIQAALHCHAFLGSFDLEKTVMNLNRLVCENTNESTFVTLVFVTIDLLTRRLRYLRAGHEVPLLATGDGVRRLDEGGLMVGVFAQGVWPMGDVQLAEGDLLCLYTDGITEARNPRGEEYGVDRLEDFLSTNRSRDAAEIGRALVRDLEGFTRTVHHGDDVTLIVLKVSQEEAGAGR